MTDPDVTEALRLVDKIEQTIEDEISEDAKLTAAEYFESVADRAKAIGTTIERMNRVTANQLAALENMLSGIERWAHNG